MPDVRRRHHPESQKNWIAALDRLAALNPAIVVAGHKKPGAPDSLSMIQDTKRYLQDFDRVQKTTTSDQDLFDQMTELYPHWVANQSWQDRVFQRECLANSSLEPFSPAESAFSPGDFQQSYLLRMGC